MDFGHHEMTGLSRGMEPLSVEDPPLASRDESPDPFRPAQSPPRTVHYTDDVEVDEPDFRFIRATGCNLCAPGAIIQAPRFLQIHYLECGHRIVSGDETCSDNCLIAKNWYKRYPTDVKHRFACAACIQMEIEELYKRCATFFWALARNVGWMAPGEASPREIRAAHHIQENQMEKIGWMMEGRYCKPWTEDVDADLSRIPYRIPTIGDKWTKLSAEIGADNELRRIRTLFTSLRLRSMGFEFEIKIGTEAEVDLLADALDGLVLNPEQKAEFDLTGFDDNALLLELAELTIEDHQLSNY